jgi:stage V sporulation protein AC
MTNAQYAEHVKKVSPNSALGMDMLRAFLVGGSICALGEAFRQLYLSLGLGEKDAGLLTSVSLMFIAAALTALHLYEKFAKAGGAGMLVPITGFANSMASAAIEFRSEGLITGTAVKMFSICGPVLVFGTAASTLYGLISWAVQRIFG